MKNRKLLTAPEVARLCGADLKTIHNWVNAGRMRHFRTPGRHIRFRPEDVAEFMDTFGYPMPLELERRERRVVLVLDPDRDSRARIRRSLGRSFEVHAFGCPVEALLSAGKARPAAAAVDVRLEAVDGYELVRSLAALEPARGFPVVVYSERDQDEAWKRAGAVAFVPKPAVSRLRQCIGEVVDERGRASARGSFR